MRKTIDTTLQFDNSYARLSPQLYQSIEATAVPAPQLLKFNPPLAAHLGLDSGQLDREQLAALFSGNQLPTGAEPIALAYAGHQFGHWVPQLGDGRALLLGEVIASDGRRYDLQLKGSGPTRFSRRGDGRAALGPVLREYLVSEAMAALGIATSRTLAAVASGEQVWREEALPGAILTRVAASHLRIGTFQYVAAHGDLTLLRQLTDYTIARHYPTAADSDNPARALLEQLTTRYAALVSDWLQVGFIHGVLNTDNCSIAGETLDYGPCAFLDHYHPDQTFSSIDRDGRYAYANQPAIMQWNLARFAETLLPLIDRDEARAIAIATEVIESYPAQQQQCWQQRMCAKIGLPAAQAADSALLQQLLTLMADQGADFCLTFHQLATAIDASGSDQLWQQFPNQQPLQQWLSAWRQQLQQAAITPATARATMGRHNPVLIPRNHQIEAVISAALTQQDRQPFDDLLAALQQPWQELPITARYQQPPTAAERVEATFCGT